MLFRSVAAEITEKINPYYTETDRLKFTEQNQNIPKAIYCVYQKKQKKTPNTDSVPKRQNQTKTPIVVVAIAKLAHRCRRLASSSPLIAVADCSLAPHRRSIYSARRLALKNTVIFFLPRDGGEEVLQAHFP